MRWFFGFFFVSGFCSILYELVWVRLAMAQFAVTTALISIVLSAFMIGLGLGSWVAGRYMRNPVASGRLPSLRLYALVELLIGVSALVVPRELVAGRFLLERLDAGNALSLSAYYVLTGLWIGFTLIPWCACMGATFPFAMAAIREQFSAQSERSFSYLYLANVLGAVTGSVIPLLMIEEWGFAGTLRAGAALNFCLAASAFLLSLQQARTAKTVPANQESASVSTAAASRWPYLLLFGTGLTSMAVEVVWIRLFTPGLSTFVYAFATILGLYLGATYLGSRFYRRSKRLEAGTSPFLFALLAFAVVFPLLICDPRLPIIYHLRVVSILPFSFLVGWITPMILDSLAHGDPDRAGKGYAVNIAGCMLGPLVAGFLLLPWLGERYTLLVCALPWIAVSLRKPAGTVSSITTPAQATWRPALVSFLALVLVATTNDYETRYSPREVRRDSTATVTALGSGMEKQLLVNGTGMTALTPITKMMAHLPLAFLQHPPTNALVICFGMGTTHRAMLSWGISSTAVELVPSVVDMFPYFHADAEQLLRSPRSHVVVNDGRFFLERSTTLYDVIALDPPPPVEAAASSLLYSKEFYAVVSQHLRPGGILQQWLPTVDDPVILTSFAKALKESFPFIRVFRAIGKTRGCHFLASNSPLPAYSAETLASHLPPTAVADFLEWDPSSDAQKQFATLLSHELSIDNLAGLARSVPALRDDHPFNEYFALRRLSDREYQKSAWKYFLWRVGLEKPQQSDLGPGPPKANR